jgi:long-chain acyl-CoA synthetase
LHDPTAAAAWRTLRQHFPGRPLDLDIDLNLDLNLYSFGWMELSILLHDRAGVVLSEADLSRIATIRDLLRLAIDRRVGAGAPPRGEPTAALDFEQWIAPTGPLLTALGAALFVINRIVMRRFFRLRVSGTDRLQTAGSFVITPNHARYLDGLVVAAALSWPRLRHTYWANDAQRLFPHPLTRIFCRAAHLFPVDAMRPGAALETGIRGLNSGNVLGWFPEGWRSPDGRLQHFQPGIGQLLLRTGAPAVPALIGGTFEALPRGRRMPRLRRVTVTFGDPASVGALRAAGSGTTDEEQVADSLRRRLAALAERSAAAAGSVGTSPVP